MPRKVVTDQHPRFIFSAGQEIKPDPVKHGIVDANASPISIPRAVIFQVGRFKTHVMIGPEDEDVNVTKWEDSVKPDVREPRNIAYDLTHFSGPNGMNVGVVSLEALVGESSYDTAQILMTCFDRMLPRTPADDRCQTHRQLGEYLQSRMEAIKKLEARLQPIARECLDKLIQAREKAFQYQSYWLSARESERAEALRPNGKKGFTAYGADEEIYYAWLERKKPEIRQAEAAAGANQGFLTQIVEAMRSREPDVDNQVLSAVLVDNAELRKSNEALQAQMAEILKRLPAVPESKAPIAPQQQPKK